MRRWLDNLSYKLQGFMQGRYGTDEFSRMLSYVALVLVLLSCVFKIWIIPAVAWLLLVVSIYRSLSKNLYKRQCEREKYLRMTGKISSRFGMYKRMWVERRTHKYYKCPNCKTRVRIRKPPKGKNIMVHCTRCGNDFQKRT